MVHDIDSSIFFLPFFESLRRTSRFLGWMGLTSQSWTLWDDSTASLARLVSDHCPLRAHLCFDPLGAHCSSNCAVIPRIPLDVSLSSISGRIRADMAGCDGVPVEKTL